MNHIEEQTSELEALESIYCDDMEIFSTIPSTITFGINIKAEDIIFDTIRCRLKFDYTTLYPDELPIIDIDNVDGLEPEEVEELKEHLLSQAEENIGMPMIFTLVTAAQELLNIKTDRKNVEKKKLKLEEEEKEKEAERKKFEGTIVNAESFYCWKKAFDLEMGLRLDSDKDDKNKKLTGRELFMQDERLNESDLKILEEGGDYVKVDESLFQDNYDFGSDDPGSDED